MPSTSSKQQHFMQLVKAVQHGHTLHGLSKETMAKVHKAASSMSEAQVQDFARVAKRKKKASS